MFGPCPPGQFLAHGGGADFKHLKVGRIYRVTKPFTDYDGDLHRTGERWTYLGYNFVPHHDGLSLFVSLDDASEWQIRLSWLPEDQAPIIDALADYLEAADALRFTPPRSE